MTFTVAGRLSLGSVCWVQEGSRGIRYSRARVWSLGKAKISILWGSGEAKNRGVLTFGILEPVEGFGLILRATRSKLGRVFWRYRTN